MLKKTELSKAEIDYMVKHFNSYTNREFATMFNVGLWLIRRELHAIGCLRMKMEYWTQPMILYLKKHYKKKGDLELAAIFQEKYPKEKKWTLKHIEKKRERLGLKRTKDEVAKIKQGHVDRGAYKHGMTWRINRNPAPEGTIKEWRVRNYPFRVIKANNKFVPAARYIYAEHYGPIPPDHVVQFRDGDNSNLNPENLYLLNREEYGATHTTRGMPAGVKTLQLALYKVRKTLATVSNTKR